MEGPLEPERNHPETEHPAAFNPSLELLQPHDHDMTEPAIQGENGFRLSQENRFPDYDHYPQEVHPELTNLLSCDLINN